ncbi:PE family protein [Mycobacterium bourgelatii]|uniref:PE domain-containing protein n=1 Tax=Mycobacterium bourgelatii TaxID=1273442 RepID=A0A7I9YWT7_MYCBU|nr:PE family protein [Mycobacterium bourgelatii]MCV6978261.1 PE family protein [Mycobacterium bourgelatii]GFG93007.1 hypothetical protein MBOU_50490 [Mycobacterium bourgelatii]
MSGVIATPELMVEAATDLAAIGQNLNAAHMTAAAPTVEMLPAAADEVSTSVADLLSRYGQEYQELAQQAAAFHEQFVQQLTASADAYARAEAANAASLRPFDAQYVVDQVTGSVLGWLDFFFPQLNLRGVSFETMLYGLLFWAFIVGAVAFFILFVPGFFTDFFLPSLF